MQDTPIKGYEFTFNKSDVKSSRGIILFFNLGVYSRKGAMYDEDDINITDIEDILLSKKEWPSSNLLKTSAKEE